MNTHQIIQKLLDLQQAYARTYRAIITAERLQYILKDGIKDIDVNDKKLREPLLEHVGHLPMIACSLHPYAHYSKEIDLGRSLIMVSIHDIGETVLGDIFTYAKKTSDEEKEYEVVKTILPPELMTYFDEFDARTTLDAKFAKSVDSIAPFLHEISMPKLTQMRFKAYNFGSKNIEAKKRVNFEWDPKLKEIFEAIMDAYRKIEAGEPTGFTVGIDLP